MSLRLDAFLPYRLSRATEAISAEIGQIYREKYGIGRPEWRVLAALAVLGEATAKAVGAHSAQHKTKVSRAVAALEARRWLTRRPDPLDRRSEILALTAGGRRAYAALSPPLLAREGEILDRLSEADRAALLKGLTALETALGVDPA